MADNTKTPPVWDKIAGTWTQFRGEVRKQWGKLTDDDVEQVKGQRDILVGKIQQAYGVAKEDANRQIDEWAGKLKF